jgi:hypothetical protein
VALQLGLDPFEGFDDEGALDAHGVGTVGAVADDEEDDAHPAAATLGRRDYLPKRTRHTRIVSMQDSDGGSGS